jgi:hypothetical protein
MAVVSNDDGEGRWLGTAAVERIIPQRMAQNVANTGGLTRRMETASSDRIAPQE